MNSHGIYRIHRLALAAFALASLALSGVGRADDQNLEYKSWASHSVGTSVTIRSEYEEAAKPGKGVEEKFYNLTAITPDQVTIETSGIYKEDGKVNPIPVSHDQIKAKKRQELSNPLKGPKVQTKESEETLEVAGRSLKCKVTDKARLSNGVTDHTKIWSCPDVPGLLVKEEYSMEGAGGFKHTRQLAAFYEGQDNPIYKSWASQKAGTSIRKRVVTQFSGGRSLTSDFVDTLVEVTPEKAVLESQSTSDGRQFPASKTDVPAKSADVGAKEVGDETLTVGGKSYKCKVTEYTDKSEANRVFIAKTWWCAEVPGGVVKEVDTNEGTKMVVRTDVLEVNIKQ